MRRRVKWGVAAALLGAVGAWLWTPDLDPADLASRYARPPSQFVDVAGMMLHVRDTGPRDAATIVLLHGFGASLHGWEAWADALDDRWRVVRLDLPGAGLSAADPTGDYRDPRQVTVLLALLDRLGLDRVTLVGHSMGGRLAWRFAADHPERIERLVLVAPDGFASPGFRYDEPAEVPALLGLMRYVLPRFAVKMNLTPAYADPTKLSDAEIDRYRDLLRAPPVREALLTRLRQTILKEPTRWLVQIQAPTLLLWGSEDRLIPVANAADYLRALPNARLVALPGVGHLPQEEAPSESLRALVDFLNEPGEHNRRL